MAMGHKDVLKSGDEQDAIYKAPLCVFYNRTGLKKYAKKCINKRIRKQAKQELRFDKINFWGLP